MELDVSEDFIEVAAEIGVLLLLFALGLEYSDERTARRAADRDPTRPRRHDAQRPARRVAGLLLGWEPLAAVLLGGVTWISSSGVVSKALSDLGRLGFRETPAVLNLLVIEDLAMAVYLPVVAALIVGGTVLATLTSVGVALVAVLGHPARRAALRPPHQQPRRGRQRRDVPADRLRHHAARRRHRPAARGVRRDRCVPRRSRTVGPRRGTGQRADLAAARPVRRDVLPVLLVPDRSRRSGRCGDPGARAHRRDVADQGGDRLVRRRAGRCRTQGAPASRAPS